MSLAACPSALVFQIGWRLGGAITECYQWTVELKRSMNLPCPGHHSVVPVSCDLSQLATGPQF